MSPLPVQSATPAIFPARAGKNAPPGEKTSAGHLVSLPEVFWIEYLHDMAVRLVSAKPEDKCLHSPYDPYIRSNDRNA